MTTQHVPTGDRAATVVPARAPLVLFEVASQTTRHGTRVTAQLGTHKAEAVELVFEVSAEAELASVDRADAFFPIALLAAMRERRDLHIDAPFSAKLLYHANTYTQQVIQRVHPPSMPVAVSAAAPGPAPAMPERGVCTGFSGGVDSFAVLDDHFLRPAPSGFRLTHLLFNDVGSHRPRDLEAVFRRRLARIRRVAADLELPLIVTTSNQNEVLGTDFMQFDTLRNATVPLLLQSRMARFYYAATFSLRALELRPYPDMSISDPVLLPLLSSEAIDLVSVGAEATRVEKTARIAEHPIAQHHLDVCVRSPADVVNCGSCPKCLRTLFTLELLGRLEPFADLFDLEAYRAARAGFIVDVLRSRDILSGEELRAFAASRGFRPSLPLRLKAGLAALPMREWLPRGQRRALRRLLRV